MLVATPGQTATYTLHSGSGSAPKKPCHTTTAASKSSSSSNNNNNNNINAHNTARPVGESPNAVDALMKSLSVRLNRSTEYLHKAFGTTTTTAVATNTNTNTNTTTTTTGNSSSNITNNTIKTATNNYSSAAKSNKDNAVAMAVSSSTTSSFAAAAAATVRAAKAMRAAQLAKAAATTATTARKLNTVPPTVIHRYSEERLHTGSTDSLHKEMCHFKPIRAAPTTPWKCGSKSRGACLRMPKASLATKEKLNCDVSLAVGKKNNAEPDDDGDATIAYNTPYRPKPSSTLLTTIISTPSHHSAFVCLVAQMKNLVNIKDAKQSSKSGKTLALHKTRSSRGRQKGIGYPMKQLKQSPINVPLTKLILRNRQQPFVHVKKLHMSKELIIKKSVRQVRASEGDKSAASVKVNTRSKGGGKRSTASISVSTQRTRVRATKSKLINIVAFAQSNTNKKSSAGAAGDSVIPNDAKRHQRKRKHSRDASERRTDGVSVVGAQGVSGGDSSMQPVRKSARLSKDCSSEVLQITAVNAVSRRRQTGRELAKRSVDCFSPPLTRSRLRQLTQMQPSVQQNVV